MNTTTALVSADNLSAILNQIAKNQIAISDLQDIIHQQQTLIAELQQQNEQDQSVADGQNEEEREERVERVEEEENILVNEDINFQYSIANALLGLNPSNQEHN